MKKLLNGFLFSVLIIILGSNQSVEASNSLTKEDITNKIIEINEKYDIGDTLSDEDAEFVKQYGYEEPTAGTITPFFSHTFTYQNSKISSEEKILVDISGTCYINHWNPIKNEYDCDLKGVATKGTVFVELEHTAYGVLGTDGKVGKIYSKTHKSSAKTSKSNLATGNIYSGLVTHSLTVVKATAKYGNDEVTVKDS